MEYKVTDIITLLNAEYKGEVIENVSKLSPFFHSDEKSLTFAADEKFLKNLAQTRAKVIMPKLLHFFSRTLKKIEKMREDSAKVGENVDIAPNVYIGHDVVIGNNVKIFPNVTIGEGVKIGDGTVIYSNVTIREFVEIGKNCVIQPGAVIGSDGFGFVKVNGNNTKIDQIGTVIVEDEVEIGANTTIDRGAIGDTIIKKYTKIDNLVQIAHNDIIGENCLIISQVGIAGSTIVGNNVTLAGQVGVAGHLEIGDNTMIGAQSGVPGNVEANKILSGHPLVDHREDMKIRVAMKKLPELLKRVKALEEKK